jgi:citrate lyase subunit beta/citryl-CoA lyase
MRSYLFTPGDSEKKIAKALLSGADAVILDLEDSVAQPNKDLARTIAAEALRTARSQADGKDLPHLIVRLNPLDTPQFSDDVATIVPAAPDSLMLPKAEGGTDIQRLDAAIASVEPDGQPPVTIIPIATETATSLFVMGSYKNCCRRLSGIAWGAEDLSADLGAETPRGPDGAFTGPFQLARDLTLLAAVSAEVDAIDGPFIDFRDTEGLAAECAASRRDGFSGKLAIHPAQVPIINQAFLPSDEEVTLAQQIVDAFGSGDDEIGVVGIGGKMYDVPHLKRARKLLLRAERYAR